MFSVARVGGYNIDSILQAEIWGGFPRNIRGARVFVKPNLVTPPTFWDVQSVTHSSVVAAVLSRLREAGAREIIVGCCGFKGQWERTLELSGYSDVVTEYGAEMVCVQDGENYHKYSMVRFAEKEEYLSLFGIKVSDFFLSADVVINLPKMKVHNMAGVTGAIKNLMGVVSPKGSMHPGGSAPILHKRLRDLYKLLRDRVHWTLMDGIIGAEFAEQYGVPREAGVLISGTDMFQVDWAAAYYMGFPPGVVPYLRYIRDDGLGTPPEGLEAHTPVFFERPLRWRSL